MEETRPISSGVVAVWNLWIGGPPDDRRARSVLSSDELARASRFVFDVDRNRYLAGRLALRELLGRYLDRAPAEVRLGYTAHGKPEVPGETLRFNVAHSGELAVIALTEHDRLGVDVERIRPLGELDAVARTVFSAHELEVFHSLPDAGKVQGFFDGWTRKEAFVKAVGEGLSYRLDAFAVTLRPGAEARLLEVEGSIARAAAWSLIDLNPVEGWVGAVAVENAAAEVHHAGWFPTRTRPSRRRHRAGRRDAR